MTWEPTPAGELIKSHIAGEDRGAGLMYHPNTMELVIDPPVKIFWLMAVCALARDSEIQLSLHTLRSFAKLTALDPHIPKDEPVHCP